MDSGVLTFMYMFIKIEYIFLFVTLIAVLPLTNLLPFLAVTGQIFSTPAMPIILLVFYSCLLQQFIFHQPVNTTHAR